MNKYIYHYLSGEAYTRPKFSSKYAAPGRTSNDCYSAKKTLRLLMSHERHVTKTDLQIRQRDHYIQTTIRQCPHLI